MNDYLIYRLSDGKFEMAISCNYDDLLFTIDETTQGYKIGTLPTGKEYHLIDDVWVEDPVDTSFEFYHESVAKRGILLSNTDWIMTRHYDEVALGNGTTLTDSEYTAMLQYRQELRDLPQDTNWPYVDWPVNPLDDSST